MKIALLGAGGMIGQRILQEALSRGHEVTAIVRDPARFTSPNPAVKVVVGDALNVDSLSAVLAGHDVLINSTSTNRDGDPQLFSKIAHTLLTAVKKSGVPRLIVVGGAGSLYVAPGVQAVDTPQFPAEWRPGAAALRDALEIYRTADFDWLFISPAAYIHPGERTGKYRLGGNEYMVDTNGNSEITCEDYAVGLLDQAEQTAPFKRHIALAY